MSTGMIGVGSLASQTDLQQVRETQLLQSAQAGSTSAEDGKIEKGARQFEAMLLSSWLQQAEKSFATVPGGDGDDDEDASGKDQMMSLGVQSLADSMAASGGIGLGSMIAKAMHAKADAARTTELQEKNGKF
jgi:Rod binding domain-containing protein